MGVVMMADIDLCHVSQMWNIAQVLDSLPVTRESPHDNKVARSRKQQSMIPLIVLLLMVFPTDVVSVQLSTADGVELYIERRYINS